MRTWCTLPNKTYESMTYEGWAFCARTPQHDFFLAYFEKGLPQAAAIRGAIPNAQYQARWFNPRNGEWDERWLRDFDGQRSGQDQSTPAAFGGDDWGLSLSLKK